MGPPRPANAEARQAWAAAQQAVLRRVAPHVERLVLGSSPYLGETGWGAVAVLEQGGQPVPELVAQLQPLELVVWQEGVAAEVHQRVGTGRLRSLLLHAAYDFSMWPGTLPAVHSLAPQLLSLQLNSCFIRGSEMRAVLACTGLTRLALVPFVVLGSSYDEEGEEPALLALTRLAHLQELSISHRPTMCAAGGAALAAMPCWAAAAAIRWCHPLLALLLAHPPNYPLAALAGMASSRRSFITRATAGWKPRFPRRSQRCAPTRCACRRTTGTAGTGM